MPCTVVPAIVIGIEQTSVPGFSRCSVPGPCSTTSQQNSWPNTTSRAGSIGQRPPARRERSMNCWVCFAACRSVPQMPQHSVFTSTWPSASFGSATVSTTMSPLRKIAARIVVPPIGWLCRQHLANVGQMLAAPEDLIVHDECRHTEHAFRLRGAADRGHFVAPALHLCGERRAIGAGFRQNRGDDRDILDIQFALPEAREYR